MLVTLFGTSMVHNCLVLASQLNGLEANVAAVVEVVGILTPASVVVSLDTGRVTVVNHRGVVVDLHRPVVLALVPVRRGVETVRGRGLPHRGAHVAVEGAGPQAPGGADETGRGRGLLIATPRRGRGRLLLLRRGRGKGSVRVLVRLRRRGPVPSRPAARRRNIRTTEGPRAKTTPREVTLLPLLLLLRLLPTLTKKVSEPLLLFVPVAQ